MAAAPAEVPLAVDARPGRTPGSNPGRGDQRARALSRALSVLCLSLLAGALQIALLRELAASHVLSTLGLALRLILVVVMSAAGLGAALAEAARRAGGLERRALCAGLALATCIYPLLLFTWLLLQLEPAIAANSVDTLRLLALGALISPPFVAFGLAIALLVAEQHAEAQEFTGMTIAASLAGTVCGIALAAVVAAQVGVNSLLVATALASLPVLFRRFALGLCLAAGVLLLPLENQLEAQRSSRPAWFAPVADDRVELVYSGWSPHQKIDFYRFEDDILLGTYNGFWQWWASAELDHAHAFPGYQLLYAAADVAERDVLVIGSGAGMGVLQLEALGPSSIYAVELDPLVVSLSKGPFSDYNDDVYARHPVFAMDGRVFLETSNQTFDVVIYEGSFLTSAHPRVAVGAENYLYTREGIAAALARLRPGGLAAVLFAGPHDAFERVAATIAASGVTVAAIDLRYEDTLWWHLPVLLFSPDASAVAKAEARILESDPSGRQVRPIALAAAQVLSDARPFLYVDDRAVLRPLTMTAGLGLLGLLLLSVWPGPTRRARGYFSALGVAAVVLQYAILAQLRSLLGDPVTTSFAALLAMLIGMAWGSLHAEWWLSRKASRSAALAAAIALAGSLLWYAPSQLAAATWPVRIAVTALGLGPLGIWLGSFFPLGLRDLTTERVPWAYAWDAAGSIAGFFVFHAVALEWGLPATLVAGALAYSTTVLLRPA